jgi:hypothetical protein
VDFWQHGIDAKKIGGVSPQVVEESQVLYGDNLVLGHFSFVSSLNNTFSHHQNLQHVFQPFVKQINSWYIWVPLIVSYHGAGYFSYLQFTAVSR